MRNQEARKEIKTRSWRRLLLVFTLAVAISGCTQRTDSELSLQEGTAGQETSALQTEDGVQKETETAEAWIDALETSPSPEEPTTIAALENGETAQTSEPEKEPEEATAWETRLLIATDIHYLSPSLTDHGESFQYKVEHGDGKVVTYIDEITDAFVEQVIEEAPDAVILSGDLSLDGEKQSHLDLAKKLEAIEDAGITVLVIPGNHDINNQHAAQYLGSDRIPAEFTTPEDFREIYRDFGYDEAIYEDAFSLSYVYELDQNNWLLMLDSCQYDPHAWVGGAILSDTYDWIEMVLEAAYDEDKNVIPVAHHNLLDESEIYVDDCTIEHSEQLVHLLEDWDVNIFLSGHLHVQHTKASDEDPRYAIWEMVTSSLATPACQYAELIYRSDHSFVYETKTLDMEAWAKRNGSTEMDLLEFDQFKEPFLRQVFYTQSMDALTQLGTLSTYQMERMSNVYSDLNYHYYQGTAYQIKDSVLKNPDYQLWLNGGGGSVLSDYVEYIVRDAVRDYNRVVIE